MAIDMVPVKPNKDLVAYCGLYCGECGKFKKGRCQGCAGNEKASWCKIRSCCIDHGYHTCADCREFSDPYECKQLNNLMAKAFSLIFGSDRGSALEMIKKNGRQSYAEEMVNIGRMTPRKK
ncbi:MAG: DUF3795 domain-containing protein [Thermoplasmatota archaeon]